MSFHLYFAGAGTKKYRKFMHENNILRLLSYVNDKSAIEEWISWGNKIFVDSGAYSAHTKGIDIDIDDYINYVNERDDHVIILAELDKIPGEFAKPKTMQQLAEAPIISWENYLYMRDRLKSPDKCLPIFHQGEDFYYLEQMLSARFHGAPIPYIGISPANDSVTKNKEKWLVSVFRHIKNSSNPNVLTHGFGITTLPVLERIPLTSADSVKWVLNAAFGSIETPWGAITVSDKSTEKLHHIDYMPSQEREQIRKSVARFGYTIDQLRESTHARAIHNIQYMQWWADHYQYKDVYDFTSKQNTLF